MPNWNIFADENTPKDREGQDTNLTTIPVMQEDLQVDKQLIESGKVNVSKRVVDEDVTVDVPVAHEEVTVEKKAINQYVDTPPPAVRQDGDTTIISVLKEVLVVEKRLMLVEEVHITKKRTETSNPTQEKLRREEVIVSRTTNL
ncbi:YsnF/AvaK domain-containing protein [Mucilaginibacter sp. CSA2-8R]|uniref:YsnF/AvaK domain-containing protein n=1 Tax=Mucilaginibacter sp. CSA2-8R TaxID=3141542 RepID=UPI00315D54CA